MAGTDHTKADLAAALPAGPAIILVEPKLAANVGSVARAMANFALSDLRIVRAPGRTEADDARAFSAGATYILDGARHFHSVEEAAADLTLLLATTARERGQAKPVDPPEAAGRLTAAHIAGGGKAGILFGRERTGLENDEVALAHRVVTFPVNPAYASLNLAQAVLLMGYEWFKAATGGAPAFDMPTRSPAGSVSEIVSLFAHLEGELADAGFFRSPEKRASMIRNLRNMIHRMEPTKQDIQTLHGVVSALVEGRPGPEGRKRTTLKPLQAEEGAE
ncbi:RNA methyltransferase [Hansschlegelia quercus]|uniref:RNA methyltransferase n=1 Tax=Hansschlegelia quercus TaxID=2528245 RepID=A0A4V2JE00_9HYPH|nr:RNA methyltransferase [Hansschlegelia quercus]TBN53296.1 RNA methyltransferase [Hansschlegelia quercus]